MSRTILIACLCLLTGACAAGGRLAWPGAGQDAAEARGERFAHRACAGCHAVERTGDSRSANAPPFRDLRIRFTAASLERRLADISRRGHYEMPPVFISEDEARDIAAYVETLGRP